jgi:transglutaminase-like putative cysteine protease
MFARLLLIGWCVTALFPAVGVGADRPNQRTFVFHYGATVSGLDPARKARVWVPVPPTSAAQEVELVSSEVKGARPVKGTIGREGRFGNRMFFVETAPDKDGKIALAFAYRVTRREVRGAAGKEDREALARYLRPDALVPVTGKPLELIKDRKLPDDPLKKARLFYDLVNGHMNYRKDKPGWGRGDSTWACESGFGNCTDFHSLFISLARSQKIPARFEIGFLLPEKRGAGAVEGYHCWAFFHLPGKGWVPVDISEANKHPKLRDYYFGNLTADRVAFSSGRDLELVPKQAGKPVNFFIYPYVEVGGKEYPQAKITRTFSFQDVKQTGR